MIKTLVSSELDIPVCKLELSGWKLDRQPRDTTILETLHLPKQNTLYLSINSDDRDAATEEYIKLNPNSKITVNSMINRRSIIRSVSRMTQTYSLNIYDVTHNRTHIVNFPGTKTLLEVKRDVSDLTNIPVRNQSWSGWPLQLTDDVIFPCEEF